MKIFKKNYDTDQPITEIKTNLYILKATQC